VISLTFRVIFFVLMLVCNALMMSNFLVALEKQGSLMVVIVSSSINMILTGIFGLCLLGENVKDNWFVGAFLMSVGVTLIAISQDVKNEKVGVKAEGS
jgi:drug/metabolite transporter (DMT)-like permease